MNNVRTFNFQVDMLLPDTTYQKLPYAWPQLGTFTTLFKLHSRMTELSGVKARLYDCCMNSCICYTGKYTSLDTCSFCNEPRFNRNGKPRQTFKYIPFLPQLCARLSNCNHATELLYRADFEHRAKNIRDIFDASHYQGLLKTFVTVAGQYLGHKFFSDPRDIALGLSFDGFGPFKRRKHTCWPIILFNYNLPPEVRFKLSNLICVGVIPGPKQAKDTDSFLAPLVDELLAAAEGVRTYDAVKEEFFPLHVYLIVVFGDMPAVAKLMRMKGHNGVSPCRVCTILGISGPGSKTLYTPLHRHDTTPYNPRQLPLRHHNEFIHQARLVDEAPTDSARDKLSRIYGIAGTPILAQLSSLSFPTSFPLDFMHLIYENVTKTLLDLWSGDFKGMDDGIEEYTVEKAVWEGIGARCKASGNTIPAAFGSRVPNIATERSHFIAETWSFWTMFLGPVLLRNKFKKPIYYKHFVSLVHLLSICTQYEISKSEVDEVEEGMAKWVGEYERYVACDKLSLNQFCTHNLMFQGYIIKRTSTAYQSARSLCIAFSISPVEFEQWGLCGLIGHFQWNASVVRCSRQSGVAYILGLALIDGFWS